WVFALEIDPQFPRSYKDQVYLRLADTYLLLAEAYHKSGDNGSAAQYINALRARANATPIAVAQVDMDFILDERARELFSESQRRYTLLRNGNWMERTMQHNIATKGKISERDKLYPIPQSFIDANLDKEIQNNPGY
ncbi:MAG: RagB/SusD family nutrient uptake outer membrane protein, partial [Saprospiraceae bacterium]|nr:RagB/SusD family nutrient uptake outer membrane protein [Saprospiraceae bacterium]